MMRNPTYLRHVYSTKNEICVLKSGFLISAQIRKIGNAPVKRLLESLGGWPVTTSEWTPPPFAVEYLFGRLKAEFNEGVLVEQWVGPDDKNSSMNILQVRPSKHFSSPSYQIITSGLFFVISTLFFRMFFYFSLPIFYTLSSFFPPGSRQLIALSRCPKCIPMSYHSCLQAIPTIMFFHLLYKPRRISKKF